MSNVTQKNNEELTLQGRGAKTGVALFCCSLFLFFQVLPFSPIRTTTETSLSLHISEKTGLYILPGASFVERSTSPTFSSTEHQRLTPFFFKPVPVNTSDPELLMTIKGIGPALAKRIIRTRERIGFFYTPEDLLQVKGIGSRRLKQFSPHFSFGSPSETP